MMYETNKDRQNQDRLEWVLENIGYHVEQTDTFVAWDMRLCLDGSLYAVVECKFRDRAWDPLKVDVSKIKALCAEARKQSCKPLFIVGYPGPPYFWVTAHTDFQTGTMLRMRGGERRGETPDDVFLIPQKKFKKIQ